MYALATLNDICLIPFMEIKADKAHLHMSC